MKKLLSTIVLGLLLSGNAFSEIFEMRQCHAFSKNGWNEQNWDNHSTYFNAASYDPETFEKLKGSQKIVRLEDKVLSIDTVAQKIFVTTIRTNEYLEYVKQIALWYENTPDGQKAKEKIIKDDPLGEKFGMELYRALISGYKNKHKISQQEYELTTYVSTIITGKGKYGIADSKIFIDLSNGTFNLGMKNIDGNNLPQGGGFICNMDLASSGSDTAGSSGTAFFVSNRGHLLTNNHVVEGCSISKITYQNKDYDTKLLATDKTLDLALLKAEVRPKSFFNFSNEDVKKLNKVYVAGYPLGKGLSDDLKISSGIVSSLKGFEDNSNEIQIDAPINPGNSGGPIINENGDLIAIAVSGLAKDQTEGINFGIKSSAAEIFLRSNKINPKKSMYAGIKDNDKLLEILEEGTVYTYCD